MKKIPTMYSRNESVKGHPVVPGIKPDCQWVENGEGIATVKIDGQNVKIQGGELFKRQKPKDGREYDEAAYVPCSRQDPADRHLFTAFDAAEYADGIYEAVGPNIQGGASGHTEHHLACVDPVDSRLIIRDEPSRTFDALREFLSCHPIEGIVFHHSDGRMAKVKRRDFGLPWPLK